MGARLRSLLCAWGALKGVPDGDQMSSVHRSWLNTGTGCSYFFCSRDKTLATSFHSQQFFSGLKKQRQISAFAPPKPSSICVSRCSWCCSNPQLFTSLVSDARWDPGDARTVEAGPDTTTVAAMPLCLQVATDRRGRWLSPSVTRVGTGGGHGVGLADGRGSGSTHCATRVPDSTFRLFSHAAVVGSPPPHRWDAQP